MRLLVKREEKGSKDWGFEFDLNVGFCLPKREGGKRCYAVRAGVHLLVEREEK